MTEFFTFPEGFTKDDVLKAIAPMAVQEWRGYIDWRSKLLSVTVNSETQQLSAQQLVGALDTHHFELEEMQEILKEKGIDTTVGNISQRRTRHRGLVQAALRRQPARPGGGPGSKSTPTKAACTL